MILAHISKLSAQALFFILFARSMGAEIFGVFSGVLALVIIATPFFAFGAGSVLVKNCSTDATKITEYIGNALLMSAATSLIAFPILHFIQTAAFSAKYTSLVFCAIFFSDFVFSKLNEIASQVFQSQSKMSKFAEFTILTGLLRVAAVALLYLLELNTSLNNWLLAYISSSFLGAIYAWYWCIRVYGTPSPCFKYNKIGEGLFFSAGLASQGVYNDADKALILRYDTQFISGNYSAAYKIIDIAFSPIRAFLSVTYTGFFKAGSNGLGAAYTYALRILPATIALGTISLLGILFASFLITPILGDSFENAKSIVYFLCAIPLLRSIHFVLADCFTGAGYQKTRCLIQLLFAALNVALNIYLIPIYSWKASAIVSIFCDLGLCIAFYSLLHFMISREKASKANAAA